MSWKPSLTPPPTSNRGGVAGSPEGSATPIHSEYIMAARSLHTIALEIQSEWKNVHFAAVPYLDAMLSLDGIDDAYGLDPGNSTTCSSLNTGAGRPAPTRSTRSTRSAGQVQLQLELGLVFSITFWTRARSRWYGGGPGRIDSRTWRTWRSSEELGGARRSSPVWGRAKSHQLMGELSPVRGRAKSHRQSFL